MPVTGHFNTYNGSKSEDEIAPGTRRVGIGHVDITEI